MPATPATVDLSGHVLYLCDDAQQMEAQLAGRRLPLEQVGPLRDDVSTDEITPVAIMSHYDERLGRFAYIGFTAQGSQPIASGAVAQGGFSVTVAGKRYGKGSSREHSPAAEKLAGIRLVIAQSFERLYRQNADNIGLFTSTDFGLLARIERGEPLSVDDLLAGREPLAAAILRSGGLLAFALSHLRGSRPEPVSADPGPQTLFEKIVARHALSTPVTSPWPAAGQGMFVQADWRFIHEYYTGMAAHMLKTHGGVGQPLHHPDSIVVFEDHSSYMDESPAHLRQGLLPNMRAMCQAQRDFVAMHGLRCHRTLTEQEARLDDGRNVAGISHAMMAEHYALPGQLVVGTDSHTPHSGALGCVAFGVGTTDMAAAFLTGAVRMTVPRSLRVAVDGRLPEGVTAKDLVLQLLARADIRAGAGLGRVFEFCGSAVQAMSIDERATLTNMTAELGGLTGIVAPDERTLAFLRERRGVEFALQDWMRSDPDAHWDAEIRVDAATLEPMVAAPGDPGKGLALSEVKQPVRIDIAYGGSCTAGKREDFDHYHAVLAWALSQGLALPSHVTLYLQYGTTAVRDHCVAKGYERTFRALGARLLQPSCGACANCGPGSSTHASQVTVSAINRNFPGRSGPGQVWLASPPTVMASALAGELISFEGLKARVAARRR